MAESDRSYSRDVPQRLPSQVARKPLGKKQLAMVLDLYRQPGRRFCNACDGRCQRAAGTKAALNDITRCLSYYEMNG